jgi:hypothetical protein
MDICTREKTGNCGMPGFAPFYFLSFFIISSLLLLNLLVAIILDNFGDDDEDPSSVNEEDLEHFKSMWAIYDNRATGFVAIEDLIKVVASLYSPLGVAGPKPNEWKSREFTPDEIAANRKEAKAKVREMDVPDRSGKVTFNESLSALASLATPEVVLSEDLLQSEMMKDLYVKKQNIEVIKRDNRLRATNDSDLPTVDEAHSVSVIQARIRGNKARKSKGAESSAGAGGVAEGGSGSVGVVAQTGNDATI